MLGAILGALKLASLWSRITGFVSGAAERIGAWVERNPKDAMLILAAVAIVVLSKHGDHIAHQRDAALAQAKASDAARAISDASVHELKAQIAAQNLAVMALRKASDDAQAAGAKAQAAAQSVADQRNANAGRIVPVVRAPVVDCRTPDAVMSAQGGV